MMAKATAGKKDKKCGVVVCNEEHKSLHLLSNLGEARARLLKDPDNVGKNIFVCANHFARDCFNNLGQYCIIQEWPLTFF